MTYAREQLHAKQLFAYTVSFGGYITLKYIHDHGSPFDKIILRSPAVNIYEALTTTIMQQEDMEKLQKGKPVSVGFDRKIEVTMGFLEELRQADVQQLEYLDFAEDILVIHGTKDEVVPYAVSAKFADENCIEMVTVEGADHRFQNPNATEQATKAIIAFCGF